MTILIYSAIFGGYDIPKPQPAADVPCVMLTDDDTLDAPGWLVHRCRRTLDHLPTPMLRSRHVKIEPELFLPDFYDADGNVVIYVDGSVTVTDPNFVQGCLDVLGDDDVAFVRHPDRDCIVDELDVCCTLTKYPADRMREQVAYYQVRGHPKRWGLFACTVMVRRCNTRTRWLGEQWWAHNVAWSWMDQLSLPVIVRGMPELRWNDGLRWRDGWDLSGREWG